MRKILPCLAILLCGCTHYLIGVDKVVSSNGVFDSTGRGFIAQGTYSKDKSVGYVEGGIYDATQGKDGGVGFRLSAMRGVTLLNNHVLLMVGGRGYATTQLASSEITAVPSAEVRLKNSLFSLGFSYDGTGKRLSGDDSLINCVYRVDAMNNASPRVRIMIEKYVSDIPKLDKSHRISFGLIFNVKDNK